MADDEPCRIDAPWRRRPLAVAAVAIVIGMVLVGATLRVPRGSGAFYACGYALAAVWIVAALAVQPGAWPRAPLSPPRRGDLLFGVVVGLATFAAFAAAAEVGRRISILAGPIDTVLRKADAEPLAAVLALALANAVAEELFFRGALPWVLPARRGIVASVVVYAAVTAVGGNTALTIAAVVMGAVFAYERHRTGGLAAPIVTHAVWSTLMITALPR